MGPVGDIVFIVICIIVSQPGASNCCQHFLCLFLFLFPLALSGSETPDEGHTDCMTIVCVCAAAWLRFPSEQTFVVRQMV